MDNNIVSMSGYYLSNWKHNCIIIGVRIFNPTLFTVSVVHSEWIKKGARVVLYRWYDRAQPSEFKPIQIVAQQSTFTMATIYKKMTQFLVKHYNVWTWAEKIRDP